MKRNETFETNKNVEIQEEAAVVMEDTQFTEDVSLTAVEAIESVEAEKADSKFRKALKTLDVVTDKIANVLLIAAVPVLVFLAFFGDFSTVSGTSMDSTLADGDRIVSIDSIKGLDRGDIVIASPEQMDNRLVIKRAIALEGDRISIEAGEVFLNGERLDEDYVDRLSVEDYMEEVVVPEGYVWVMGDNRNNSLDSRQIGFVSVDDLEGIAIFRVPSVTKIEKIN